MAAQYAAMSHAVPNPLSDAVTPAPDAGAEELYERIMVGCRRRHRSLVYQLLMDLIDAIEFSHRDEALDRFRMYETCIRLARANRFNEVARIIDGLRQPRSRITLRSFPVMTG